MADGWSIKRLIRRIVLSRAYGLDSSHDPHNFEADPDNALVWRMSKRRLEAEALRDALLFVSGRLAPEPPVGSAVARTGEGLALFLRLAGLDASDRHRSVYLPVVRDGVLESLALFDFADPSVVTGDPGHNDRPGPGGAYFMNGHVCLATSRGPGRSGFPPQDSRADARRVDRAYRLTLGRSADGRRAGPRPRVPPRLYRTRGGPTRRLRPGRRSARHSSPAPSSDTFTDHGHLRE